MERKTHTIDATGKVLGSDFELPSQIELMNKDAEIATLTSKSSELEIEILVENGMGYEPVESRKKGKLEIGTVAIDAIFTPIRKVSYRVENVRVGERTDFDRLVLELETDGSVTPEGAVNQASEILVGHFALIGGTFLSIPQAIIKKTEKKYAKAKKGKKTK